AATRTVVSPASKMPIQACVLSMMAAKLFQPASSAVDRNSAVSATIKRAASGTATPAATAKAASDRGDLVHDDEKRFAAARTVAGSSAILRMLAPSTAIPPSPSAV